MLMVNNHISIHMVPVNFLPLSASRVALTARTVVDDLVGEDIAIDAKVVSAYLTRISPTLADPPCFCLLRGGFCSRLLAFPF